MRRLAVFLLVVLTGLPALAQQPDTLSSAVVTAQSFGAAPSAIVSGSLLETSASAADAVRSFSGLQLKDYGGLGGLKTVNVRSLGSEHLGVFVDGVPVDQTQNMQVDLGRLSTWGWESAALYQGQKADALMTAREYGSATALHFRTAAPILSRLRLRAQGGAFGSLSCAGLWDKLLTRRLSLRVSAEAMRTEGDYRYGLTGYREREGAWQRFDTTLVRENGDMTACRAEAALFGRIPEGEWRLQGSAYRSERGFPGPVIRRAAEFPLSADRQEDRSTALQGSFRRSFGAWSLALRGKYADEYTHYATHPERNPMALPYDHYYRQRSGYLSLSQALSLSERFGFSLAVDGQFNGLDSDVGQFVRPTRWTLYGAIGGRYAWSGGWALASVQGLGAWDRYDASAGGFSRENRRRGALSPFLQAGWRPLEGLELSAFYKRSYRLPSFNDLYYTLIGNADLSPESARQLGLDLSFRHRIPSFRAALYHNRVRDKIVAIPTASQFRWTMLNLGTVDITGAELEAGIRTASIHSVSSCPTRSGISAGATLRYTYQRAVDHTDPAGTTYGNQIPYIPLHSGSLSLDGSWRGWRLDLIAIASGLRYSRTANIPDYEVDPYLTADLRLSKELDWRFADLTLRLSVNNLFDSDYAVVQGYPMPGIHALFGVEVSL